MSAYIKLEKKSSIQDELIAIDGKAVGKHWKELNSIAKQRGVKTLDEFVSASTDDLANLMGEEDMEEAGIELPKEQWFSAAEGVRTIDSLINYCRDNKKAFENGNSLLADLEGLKASLNAAQSKKIGFHFFFDS